MNSPNDICLLITLHVEVELSIFPAAELVYFIQNCHLLYAEEMDREEIAKGCTDQAGWAAKLGSPMYEALLQRMAQDVRDGGPCLAALEPKMQQSPLIAPLMLLAAVHRMVLEGTLPGLAPYYPSRGGRFDIDAVWPHFLTAVPGAVLPPCVQTNEIGRSAALLPGFVEVARRTSLPLRLLEIGASAGLNLRWDHFAFLDVPACVRVVERRGCDLNPIDPTLDESRAALLCFIWPDQTDRLRQFESVVEIARRVPAAVDRADAIQWLPTQLSETRPEVATIVFHSAVTPYLTQDARDNLRRTIEAAGERATTNAPLAWLSMEPGGERADIHLAVWPGGERRLIAQASYHGRDVKVIGRATQD